MFAYYGNNPVCFSDPSGCFRFYKLEYAHPNGSDGDRNIYNQKDEGVRDIPFGLANVGHSGCGPVALYNALQLLGQYHFSFEEILQYYEDNHYLTWGGLLGSEISGCVRFLEDQGYIVMLVPNTDKNEDIANIADVCILWYCFRQSGALPVAAHYVAFTQTDGIGKYYNAYSNQTSIYTYRGGPNSFMRDYADGGLGGLLICVFEP